MESRIGNCTFYKGAHAAGIKQKRIFRAVDNAGNIYGIVIIEKSVLLIVIFSGCFLVQTHIFKHVVNFSHSIGNGTQEFSESKGAGSK